MMTNIMMPQPHEILSVLKETQAEYTFRVACNAKTQHGQFFMLSIPKIGEAPISVSGKGPGYVEFTIRKVGRLTEGVFGLKAGDTLFMRGPYGNAFPVEQFENKNLVFITGGTGLAPVRTLINHFYDHPEICKSVYLISGFKDVNAVLFSDDIRRFQEKFHMTATLDNTAAPGFETGLVTEHIKKIPFAAFDDFNVVVVGPPIMMHFAARELITNGVDESKIWVSFERKMSCAVGKCGHCKINETYVCLEGPVFNYVKAKELLD